MGGVPETHRLPGKSAPADHSSIPRPFMPGTPGTDLQNRLDGLDLSRPERVSRLVDLILEDAVRRSASDVHFEPTYRAVEVRFRLDGVLQHVASLNRELAPNVVARLKVMAELLTYRLDVPQEGGVRQNQNPHGADMRVSTFPTVHG